VIAKQGEIVFRVFASNGSGGVSVVIDTIEAALGKVSEFRAEGFLCVSVLDAHGKTIEDAAISVMTDGGIAR
jgi:hypothetical protein